MSKEFENMMKEYSELEKEIMVLDDIIKAELNKNRNTDDLTLKYNRKVEKLSTLGEKIRIK